MSRGGDTPRSALYVSGVLLGVSLLLQGLTGLVLAFYYQPSPDRAFASVYFITSQVPYGWLVRSVHAWGSRISVAAAVLFAVMIVISAMRGRAHGATLAVTLAAIAVTVAAHASGALLTYDAAAYASVTAGPVGIAAFSAGLDASQLAKAYAGHLLLAPVTLLVIAWICLRRLPRRPRVPWTPVVLLLCAYLALSLLLPAEPGDRIRGLATDGSGPATAIPVSAPATGPASRVETP